MNINIDKIINSIKLDHTYTFHLKEEIMKTFVGQKRVIAELAENLGTFKKSEIIRKLGEHLGNKTRQSPLIIFAFYQGELLKSGILTVEKAKRIPKQKTIVRKGNLENHLHCII